MNKKLVITTAAAVLALTACKNSDYEGYTKAESGLHYKFFTHDESGVTPHEGDGVAFKYVIKRHSDDSVLVDSKAVSRDGSGVTKFILPKSSFVGSIEDALMMLAKGDSAAFILSADSFFLKTNKMQALPPYIKPGEHLTIIIKLTEIKNKAELEANQKMQQEEMAKETARLQAAEQPAFEKHIADNKITAKPTPTGLIFIEEKKGKGAMAKPGDSIAVHYAGTLLDGTEFDNSFKRGEPIGFVVGIGRVIPGWEEALQLMSKGTKAKIVIPSNLAYGPQGNQGIAPYSTLVFELEIVDIFPASK